MAASPPQTLLDVLQQRVTERPAAEAFSFLIDGEAQEESITYAELYRRARAIGARLQALGRVPPGCGERALILCPFGVDYIAAFYGCIAGGWGAVPLYSPDLPAGIETIRSAARIAGPRAGITTCDAFPAIRALFGEAPELASLVWIMADDTLPSSEAGWRQPEIDRESLAYLVFTSGSTSAPKGVLKKHKNLRLIPIEPAYHAEERILIWNSPSTTTGLTMGFVLPVCAGMPCTYIAPEKILERPARWIEAMARTRATQSATGNFAFDLAVDDVPPEDRPALDLSHWEVAATAGEQVRAETIERFQSAFAVSGLRRDVVKAGYGLTEAARIVGAYRGQQFTAIEFDRIELEAGRAVPLPDGGDGGRTLVSLGAPNPGVELLIVNPETRVPLPPQQVGEIWTAGEHVSDGYWNAPDATRDAFQAYLADGRGPYFHTGDLGFIYREQLFITGRLKDIIIFRGRNIPATDIEEAAQQAHPALGGQESAAFAIDAEGDEELVIVQELGETGAYAEIANAMRRAVASQIGVQVHTIALVRSGEIPRTRSSKVGRAACRDAFLAASLPILFTDHHDPTTRRVPFAPPTTPLEWELAAIWERVLGVHPIGVHDELTDLGGDSLRSLQVQARLRERGLHIGADGLRQHGTIAGLAGALAAVQAVQSDDPPLVGPMPLLLMQYGVLGTRPEPPADLVVAEVLTALQPLDTELLERAARAVIIHHDALRMRFQYGEDGWAADCVAYTPARVVSFVDLSRLPPAAQRARMADKEAHLRERIDIGRGINLQIAIFDRGPGRPQRVALLAPHLAFDALSLSTLVGDLDTAYRLLRQGAPIRLPAKTTSIREWGLNLRELVASGAMESEIEYWSTIVREEPVTIPPDADPRPCDPGGLISVWTELAREPTRTLLREAPTRHGFRVIDALLYATAQAVSPQTGASSVLIDTWAHGREPLTPEMDLSRTMGYFTVQFPVRVALDPEGSPLAALARLQRGLQQLPRGGVGFDALRYLCTESRCDALRTPDRPIRINYYGEPASRFREVTLFARGDPPDLDDSAPDAAETEAPVLYSAARTDLLDIAAFIEDGKLRVRVNYHTAVYCGATIEAFTADIGRNLAHIASLSARDSSILEERLHRSNHPVLLIHHRNQPPLVEGGAGVDDV